jgi:hypothetical protein
MADDAGLRGWAEHRSDVNLGRDNVAGALYHPTMLPPIAVRETREVPVLFFQAGDAQHLPYTFWQARHWAGSSPLILMGDKANRHYRGLEHVPIQDFASSVPRLRDLYAHISSNTEEFEFLCLARWLVMGEYARRQGLREFLYLDSDVLIYEKPAEIVSRVPACRLATEWIRDPGAGISPAVTYIRDLTVLQEIEACMLQFYSNPKEIENMRVSLEESVRKKLGGMSDMLFLARYASRLGEAAFNLWEPEKDGVVDINITQAAGFRLREGLKEIEFRDGKPYGFYEPTQRWVRFAALHFNGHSKKVMGEYLGRPADFGLTTARLSERVQKVLGRHKPALF